MGRKRPGRRPDALNAASAKAKAPASSGLVVSTLTLVAPGDFLKDVSGWSGPDEGLGCGIVLLEVDFDGGVESGDAVEDAASRRSGSSSPKRGRRSRTWKIFLVRRRLGRESPSRIWTCRTVSFDTQTPSISRTPGSSSGSSPGGRAEIGVARP